MFVYIDLQSTRFSLFSTFQARDLGPRLFAAFVYGWHNVFEANNYYFWVPIVGPISGAILGVWIFTGYESIIKKNEHFFNSGYTGAV